MVVFTTGQSLYLTFTWRGKLVFVFAFVRGVSSSPPSSFCGSRRCGVVWVVFPTPYRPPFPRNRSDHKGRVTEVIINPKIEWVSFADRQNIHYEIIESTIRWTRNNWLDLKLYCFFSPVQIISRLGVILERHLLSASFCFNAFSIFLNYFSIFFVYVLVTISITQTIYIYICYNRIILGHTSQHSRLSTDVD